MYPQLVDKVDRVSFIQEKDLLNICNMVYFTNWSHIVSKFTKYMYFIAKSMTKSNATPGCISTTWALDIVL